MSHSVVTAPDTTGTGQVPTHQRRRATRWVGWAAVTWLGFVVLHRLLSGRVWWWGLVELVPPFMFLVVPLGLLAWLPALRRDRRALAVVGAVAVLCALLGAGLGGLNPASLWHRLKPAPPDAVTVFAWNTWYWDQRAADGSVAPPPSGTPAAERIEFYRFLQQQSADIYLLQEYLYLDSEREPMPVDALAELREAFPDYHVATRGELITLSRFPIVRQRAVDLRPWLDEADLALVSAAPELVAYHTVKVLRTDLRLGEQVVSFYNVHLHAPVEPVLQRLTPSRLSRAHELRRAGLRALRADFEDNPQPAFVAGDLNTTPAMGALRELPDRLVDATAVIDSLYPTSWERRLPWWRIDWVFTTPDLAVHRYRMVPPGPWSDHSGQEVIVSVR